MKRLLALLMALYLVLGALALAEDVEFELENLADGDVVVEEEELAVGAEDIVREADELLLFADGEGQAADANAEAAVSNISESDFEIKKGVLVSYTGSGGDVVIPKGVTSIGGEAFYRCKSLTSVVIPEGVVRIESGTNADDGNAYDDVYKGAFAGCVNLKKVTLPKGLKVIGGGAFYRCRKLAAIDIPNTVKDISANAFQESGLKSIVIPDSVVYIWDAAFCGCVNLKKVTLPKQNKAEAYYIFRDCSALEELTIPGGFELIADSMFEGCTNLKKVTICEGVATIGYWAFVGCKSLQTVIIPRSVTKIWDEAFNTKKMTIYGYPNTAAQRYAKANKITFVSLNKVLPKVTELKSVEGDKKKITVKWEMVRGVSGYEIQYGLKKDFSDAKTMAVKGAKTTSKVLKNLKAKKTYYIRVCTYNIKNGETWRSAWSKANNVKTK